MGKVRKIMKKGKISAQNLILLCDKNEHDDVYYESKKGKDYINALKDLFKGENKNDIPFCYEDILNEPLVEDFQSKFPNNELKNEFHFVCELEARPMELNKDGDRLQNEKIIPIESSFDENYKNSFYKSLGVAYMITCLDDKNKEHIIKFGQSRTTFKDRLGSYNCGVVNNWRTASTTNFKILQSMVTTRRKFKLYIRDCGDEAKTFKWAGEESVPFASPLSLVIEDICMKKFNEVYHKNPLANVQAKATEVN